MGQKVVRNNFTLEVENILGSRTSKKAFLLPIGVVRFFLCSETGR